MMRTLLQGTVGDVMSNATHLVSLTDAAFVMTEQNIHHLVVLDDSDRAIGILSSLDLLTKLNEAL